MPNSSQNVSLDAFYSSPAGSVTACLVALTSIGITVGIGGILASFGL